MKNGITFDTGALIALERREQLSEGAAPSGGRRRAAVRASFGAWGRPGPSTVRVSAGKDGSGEDQTLAPAEPGLDDQRSDRDEPFRRAPRRARPRDAITERA